MPGSWGRHDAKRYRSAPRFRLAGAPGRLGRLFGPWSDPLRVLVIGSGGREHALALALGRDPAVAELHAAPGNPGTAALATNHPVDPLDGTAVAALATRLGVNLVVVGPEAPLVAGVADAVRAAGIACFGPSAAAARIEGSKAFAKEVMAAAGVPTARSQLSDARRGRSRAGRVRAAVRGQGRRPGRRQGRGGHRGSAGRRRSCDCAAGGW